MWNDPTAVIILVVSYLTFVIVGKRVMRDRPEFKVPTSVLFVYNIALVLLSIYMFEEVNLFNKCIFIVKKQTNNVIEPSEVTKHVKTVFLTALVMFLF